MIFPEQMKQDLIDMQPSLPIIQQKWRELSLKTSSADDHKSHFEVVGFCPMCALSEHIGLPVNLEAGEFDPTVLVKSIAAHYNINTRHVMRFVVRWDTYLPEEGQSITDQIRKVLIDTEAEVE